MFKVGDAVRISSLVTGMRITDIGRTAVIEAIFVKSGLPYMVKFDDTGGNSFFSDKELELYSKPNASWKQVDGFLELSFKPKTVETPKAVVTCTCLSLDLFNFGCKCGWKDKV